MLRHDLLASLLAAPMLAVAAKLGFDERPKIVEANAYVLAIQFSMNDMIAHEIDFLGRYSGRA